MPSVTVYLLGDTKGLTRAYKTAAAETKAFGGSMVQANTHVKGMYTSMLKMTALLAGGGGLAIGFKSSVTAARDFQSAMEQLHTQAGATQKEVRRMSTAVRDLGPAVGSTPQDLAKGLYFVESAGIRSTKALNVLRLAAEGAAVGHSDLEQTTKALTAATKSGISGTKTMSQAMGTLNATIGAGMMRMDDLVGALSTGILPAARGVGLNLKDVGAALATMTNAGVPAEAAATRLRMTFSLMAAPTKAATDALKAIGLSQLDLAHTMRTQGLVAALAELKQHLIDSGATAEQQSLILARAFGGGRTSSAIITLIQNLDGVRKAQKQIGAGATGFGKSWEAEQKTAEFASKRFHAALSGLEIAIGTALLPTITNITKNFTDWIEKINKSGDAAKYTKGAVDTLKGLVSDLWPIVKTAADMFKVFADNVGGTKKAIELLAGAMVTWKIVDMISGLGASSKKSAAEVALLNQKLLALKTMGLITVGVSIALFHKQLEDATQKALDKLGLGFLGGIVNFSGQDLIKAVTGGGGGAAAARFNPSIYGGASVYGAGATAGTTMKGSAKGKAFTRQQLANLWIAAGGDPSKANVAVAIAMAESSGRSVLNDNPRTGDYSVSPWQINYYGGLRGPRTKQFGTPEQLLANPMLAARAAVSISNRGADFSAWSTYKNKAYLQYLGAGTGGGGGGGGSSAANKALRDWLKGQAGGGKGGATGPRTEFLTVGQRVAIAQAQVTAATADDLKAFSAAIASVRRIIAKGLKGEALINALQELGSLKSDLKSARGTVAKASTALPKGGIGITPSQIYGFQTKIPGAVSSAIENLFPKGPKGKGIGVDTTVLDKFKMLIPATVKANIDAINQINSDKLAAKLKQQQDMWASHIDALQKMADEKRGAFETAYGRLADAALNAFDKATQKGMSEREAERAQLTPAELALKNLQETHDSMSLEQQLADDRRLGDAKAVEEDLYQIQVRALQFQADTERAARDKSFSEQEQAYQDEREQQRTAFQQQLTDLQDQLETRHMTINQANDQILGLMKQFGLDPRWSDAGANAGSLLISGLASAFLAVGDTLGDMSSAQRAVDVASAAAFTTTTARGGVPPGISIMPQVPMLQSGGQILSTGLAYLHKGETVVPAGAGGSTMIFNFPNYVGDKRDLETAMRNAAQRFYNRNARSAFA